MSAYVHVYAPTYVNPEGRCLKASKSGRVKLVDFFLENKYEYIYIYIFGEINSILLFI